MSDIKIWEEKIKAKRMQTPRREFVKEIGSWFPLVLNKNQGIISKYPSDTGRIGKIISPKEFEENRQELTNLGIEYSPTESFFNQFQKLLLSIKMPALLAVFQNENCDYAEDIFGAKNSYLAFGVGSNTENVLYTCIAKDNCRNVFNSSEIVDACENIYMASGIMKSYNIFFSRFIADSANIRFSTNLMGCQECLLCDNLQNKSYCIENVQYDKDTYLIEKQKSLKQKANFLERYKNLKKGGTNFSSENIIGDFIVKSTNIENGQYVYQVENGRNLVMVGGFEGDKNMYDIFLGGTIEATDAYASTLFGAYSHNLYCIFHAVGSSNIYYSRSLESCSYCLGCIGLKNKSYCIFNKEYDKEKRYELANKIFEKMDADGTLGKFLPATMNPFYFNDTAAYLIDDTFTKEEVTKEGYLRRDNEIKVDIPQDADVVETQNLASYEGFDENGKRQINPDILKKVIKDEKGNYYRIVKMEYDFLMKHGLPLPELHRLERIKLGFKFK